MFHDFASFGNDNALGIVGDIKTEKEVKAEENEKGIVNVVDNGTVLIVPKSEQKWDVKYIDNDHYN